MRDVRRPSVSAPVTKTVPTSPSFTRASARSRPVSFAAPRASSARVPYQPAVTATNPMELIVPYRRHAALTTSPRSAESLIRSTDGCSASRPKRLPPSSAAIPSSWAARPAWLM
jgi:hypothetical protein